MNRRSRIAVGTLLAAALLPAACAAGDLSTSSGAPATTAATGGAESPGAVPGWPGPAEPGFVDPDTPVSSPELPPVDPGDDIFATTTSLAPSLQQGVVVGYAVGGLDCPPDQACIAIAVTISGRVQAVRDGQVVAETAIDDMGGWGLSLEPGTYRIVTVSETGRCDDLEVTAVANAVVETGMTCVGPPP